ncbi:alkene reductase [Cryobacterium sp. GrIS_2_6]|uniref:alkene reductase n=1 Tax=Cryobacterium sp. GrIS_2_6 TaxID=3162785 RepID=UPI002DFA54CC|nr:2,4-dienoyl-CoA reductase-like NADH-dependent reductase (Old Yellow Enzyme family) [Cryobacterium psychrotolerans]
MTLFSPLTLGDLHLPNRLVMAPLTRTRAGLDGIPGPMVIEHYRQRASLGLIVSEGVYPSHAGQGYTGQPGLVTAEQVDGWRSVASAVHEAGGLIVAQVMHAGRVSHDLVNGGFDVVAPSAIAIEGETHTPEGKKPYPVPHALTEAELPGIVAEFVRASQNAIAAGLDGVEIHSANGYLLHEFLSPASNQRTDAHGGSPANRARFVIEVATAVAAAIGGGRVGIRISPEHNIQDVLETDAAETLATYTALVDGLAPLGLAYLSVLHKDPTGDLIQGLRAPFGGPLLINTGFGTVTTRAEAIAILADDVADAVVVGRAVIANPDLVHRWRDDLPLNALDPQTLYGSTAAGYTDYPALATAAAE